MCSAKYLIQLREISITFLYVLCNKNLDIVSAGKSVNLLTLITLYDIKVDCMIPNYAKIYVKAEL